MKSQLTENTQEEKQTPGMRMFHWFKKKPSPARKAFQQFKQKYSDCILFFRMGDFYEAFYEDAKRCSQICDDILESRSKGDNNPVPLVSVPRHTFDDYLKRILDAGFKVAVCEQVKGPKTTRDVIKIYTPTTVPGFARGNWQRMLAWALGK